jgi:hypothetical protein
MRVHQMLPPKRGIAAHAWVGVVAVAALVAWPLGATASPGNVGPRAWTASAAGVVYGGLTQGTDRFPVVIEVSKSRKQIVRATAAIRLRCSSGGSFTIPDSFDKLKVSKKGKFGVSYGPETFRNDDGTTDDVEGSISGAFNAARTKVSGKWQSKLTHHDATGAVVDTCDSGVVSWSAKD